jgi:hypothetical protein
MHRIDGSQFSRTFQPPAQLRLFIGGQHQGSDLCRQVQRVGFATLLRVNDDQGSVGPLLMTPF